MAALSDVVDGSLCRACSGRMIAPTSDGERLQECPKDEERQAECLARLLFRLACLDEALRHYAAGRATQPELKDILDFWAEHALGPEADPSRLCFRDVLMRGR
ncbi:MAG: hypothetical protein HY321_21045 [Armatimonadetes bacterium]|nr:hypothetical protein [Armatimonadota bacterium]